MTCENPFLWYCECGARFLYGSCLLTIENLGLSTIMNSLLFLYDIDFMVNGDDGAVSLI